MSSLQSISGRDRERLAGLRDDLIVIHALTADLATPDAIRRTAVCFRRLFIDGELQFGGSVFGRRISLVTPPPIPGAATLAVAGITYYQRSPARLGSVEVGDLESGAARRPNLSTTDPFDSLPAGSIDRFLNQRIAYFHGEPIRRREFIQHAANIMGGAHFGARLKNMETVEKLRRCVHIAIDGDVITFKLEGPALLNKSPELVFYDEHYNPVHLELLASARLLSLSSDVVRLLDDIKKVLADP